MAEAFQYVLCPYCGQAQSATDKCAVCGGLFEPLSRKATQISMGPWYIRDKRMPFRPGCSYEMLKKQIQAGKVKATTVLRGPTTRQFWSVARNTPGIAHLLGFCHACGAVVKPDDKSCSKCQAKFEDVAQRNELGLMFPTKDSAEAAQRAMDRQIAAGMNPLAMTAKPAPALNVGGGTTDSSGGTPPDLLNEVLGSPRRKGSARPVGISVGDGQALDFTPADDGDQDTPVRLNIPSKISGWTVFLILSNILLVLLLIVAVWLWSRH